MYINLDKTEIENLINLSKNEYDNLYYQLLDLFDIIPKLSNIDENWELRGIDLDNKIREYNNTLIRFNKIFDLYVNITVKSNSSYTIHLLTRNKNLVNQYHKELKENEKICNSIRNLIGDITYI
tara:strand:+ start:501 stop:872 length:372 start_codon:yes stop_codon:yes gene_type:complete